MIACIAIHENFILILFLDFILKYNSLIVKLITLKTSFFFLTACVVFFIF